MRTQRESYQLFLSALAVLVFTSIMGTAQAAVSCETNFGEKAFVIERNTVAFIQTKGTGRSLSSVLGAVTQATHKGFKKTIYKDGYKHLILLRENFSEDHKKDICKSLSWRKASADVSMIFFLTKTP